jgi:hypothetical protein
MDHAQPSWPAQTRNGNGLMPLQGVEKRTEILGFPWLREFLRIPSKFLLRCAIRINER